MLIPKKAIDHGICTCVKYLNILTLDLMWFSFSAFVTLLNGEQAENAICKFHKSIFQEREITVQLQSTDSLLCVTQLPLSYTQQQFEDLVRLHGNLERCFLVYSETTGHSKGYGFVEYMKKDSASRAKSELMGKQLGSCILYVQWTDADQLSSDFLHSKCLCIDKIPHDYKDSEELTEFFSQMFKPVFCQVCKEKWEYAFFSWHGLLTLISVVVIYLNSMCNMI